MYNRVGTSVGCIYAYINLLKCYFTEMGNISSAERNNVISAYAIDAYMLL